ncbi:organic hydroperoxide resistance protein [Rothia mucilaginosa]|uniref:organic hydroperoxide resistance protein n=1 Tax=Rothia mucilaginosa TaxID=43675 RepID=UPI0028DC5033|nr:organic hydroperoxide resistance protein [Rothia mucilaginosa]
MDALYTAEALSVGDARNGQAYLADRSLDLRMSVPKEMGGAGDGANPEQLFALGYAACFHSALKLVASKVKADTTDSAVGARVSIGSNAAGGFELAVALEVSLPNVPVEQARELAEAAHQVCPYSNATRGNIEVTVEVVED